MPLDQRVQFDIFLANIEREIFATVSSEYESFHLKYR
jgi:hypothetical protein